MDKTKACCNIDSGRENTNKEEEKDEPTTQDEDSDEVKDKPCSEEISEVTYDTQTELVSSSYENDVQFWVLVNSNDWKTAIRVGKGHLHRRLLAILHDLSKKTAASDFCTSQTYCSTNFCRALSEKWIPDHRLFTLPQNNETFYRAQTQIPRERTVCIMRKYFPLGKKDSRKNAINCTAKFGIDGSENNAVHSPIESAKVLRYHDFRGFNVSADQQLHESVLSCISQFTVLIETISDSRTFSSATYVTIQRPRRMLLTFQ